MTTLALYCNKGGVGKTTAAVNLAYLASRAGLNTLIVDLDPQSSASYFFRIKPRLKRGARGLTRAGKALDRSIKGTDYLSLDMLPADFSHRHLQLEFHDSKRSKLRLAKTLEPLNTEYDLIVFDCAPTIDLVAENIFNAAEVLLVPLIPTTLSLRSHHELCVFLERQDYRSLRVHGFLSMVDERKKMHRDLSGVMRQEFGGILQSTIPYLSQVEQMGVRREPLPAFSLRSRAALAYQALWREVEALLVKGGPSKV